MSGKKKPGVAIDQEYEVVAVGGAVDVIIEHPKNPRKGVVEAIDESIDVNGWYGAVVAQKSTGYIIVGNHRYRAALARGAKQIPVIWRDVDDQAALRILLADNKIGELGGYDEELLTELLDGLGDLKGTGYGPIGSALDRVMHEEEAEDDEVPEDKYEPAYGIMVVCESEAHQASMYGEISEQWPELSLQVVAV